MISMLASGSWNDGAGWPTCSMAPAIALQLESILAHFDAAQAPARARSRGLHEPPLAARAAPGSPRLSRLRGPALAARGAGTCRRRRGDLAPRAPRSRALVPRARADSRLALQATSTPGLDSARAGHEPFFRGRRAPARGLRLHPACTHRRRDDELRDR